MARGVARKGDILGPGGVLTQPSSPNVLVNGRPVALYNVRYTAHPCCGAKGCPPAHCGGPTFDAFAGVLVNGVPPITITGVGQCGHKVQTCSTNVFMG
jgi:hypothetical protein